jgi:glutathione S-transferase
MPALVIEPNLALFDSRVVCRYVDGLADRSRSFYPEDPSSLWRALRYESLGDGMVDAAIFARQELSRPAEKQIEDRVSKQLSKVDEGLNCLEREVDQLAGPLTVGTIAVSNALAYLDFRWSHRDWRSAHPRLAAWYDTVASRPAFVEHGFVESDLLVKKLAAGK